jgi:hypothetical protein
VVVIIAGDEPARGAEHNNQKNDRDQEKPVHARDVDLPFLGLGGAADLHARQEAELDGLLGERVGARDDRLARDDRRGRRKGHHRQQRPVGVEQVEGVLKLLGVLQEEGPLPEVVDGERGQHEAEPGGLYGPSPEMAHVGVERLSAGHREEHRAEGHEADMAVVEEETQSVGWAQRGEDARVACEMDKPTRGEGEEPNGGDRSEPCRDCGGAAALYAEQPDQDRKAQRDHVGLEGGC